MTGALGKNTPSGELLRTFVERIERIDADKKALTADRAAVLAEAKSAGFNPKRIQGVINVRKLKPHDRQEIETVHDLYMHALGMDNEPPLFRQMAAIARDITGNDKLLECFKLLVPQTGFVIFKVDDKPLRLFRDKDGNPQVEPYIEPTVAENVRSRPTRESFAPSNKDVPDVTPDAAEELGAAAFRENKSIIDNPFPFADERRARWDRGWRSASGNDGMGD